jgi:multiple sugar transport system permease protein
MSTQATHARNLRRLWKYRIRSVALLVGGLIIVAAVLLPIYLTVVVSLEPSSTLEVAPLTFFPHQWVIGNYRAAISLESGSLLTSLIVSLGSVALSIAVGVPAAYGLMKYGLLRGRVFSTVVILALLVAQMIPGISLSLAFYNFFNHLHLLNSYLGLILADSTLGIPFLVLLVRAYVASIPASILDAASVDGCGEWRAFRSIVLPLAVPAIVTASLFVFLNAWSDFLFALTLNSGGRVTPVTLGIFNFIGADATYWGPIMATVVFAALPAAIVLIFAQRFILGGLRVGALKG